jgi:hypothetical protein
MLVICNEITREVLSTKSYKKSYPPLQVKQYTPPAQMKHTLRTQQGITYAQIIKQNSYTPTNMKQEPHTNQSHQQTSDMQDLRNNEKPVWANGNCAKPPHNLAN